VTQGNLSWVPSGKVWFAASGKPSRIRLKKDKRYEAACHEAAHAITGMHFGQRLHYIFVAKSGQRRGATSPILVTRSTCLILPRLRPLWTVQMPWLETLRHEHAITYRVT
jgi:hypothetical protein